MLLGLIVTPLRRLLANAAASIQTTRSPSFCGPAVNFALSTQPLVYLRCDRYCNSLRDTSVAATAPVVLSIPNYTL